MNLHSFIYSYFKGWDIACVVTCDTGCGHLKLLSGTTCLVVFFNLNGETHWSGSRVTVDHVEAC